MVPFRLCRGPTKLKYDSLEKAKEDSDIRRVHERNGLATFATHAVSRRMVLRREDAFLLTDLLPFPTPPMAQNVSDPDGWIAEHLSSPRQKFANFADHVYDNGALERKTKELIAIATASVGRCPHCTNGHIEEAKETGASDQEIAEALAVAWAQGSGTQVFWMKDDLDDLLGENWRHDFLPQADAAFWDFKAEIFEEGVLPRKTKELLAVAVSCQNRCRHCTRSHIEAALDVGASPAEVAEAISVLWVTGGGTHVAWNQEGFEEHLHTAPLDA